MTASGNEPTSVGIVGTIGLGGLNPESLHSVLSTSEYLVLVYGEDAIVLENLVNLGAKAAGSPRGVAENSHILVCTTTDEGRLNRLLFDSASGVISALPKQAVLVISTPVLPSFYESLPQKLAERGRQDVTVVDMAIVASSVRAEGSASTVFVSGSGEAIESTKHFMHTLSDKLYVIPGQLGQASKAQLVYQLLLGLHTATAAEAMALAARAGLNTKATFDIISNAAGSSSAFETRVPQMLAGSWTPQVSLEFTLHEMKTVVSTARRLHFPLPLGSAVEQLFIAGVSQGFGCDDDAGFVRLYLPGSHELVKQNAERARLESVLTPSGSPFEISKIGMIGLGAMGQGMAGSLLRAGFQVQGYDVYGPAVDKFISNESNATAAATPSAAIKEADIVLLMVQNAAQADDVLFGSGRGAEALSDGTVVILSSTVPPNFVRKLDFKLKQLGRGITLLDAPVSGGVARAANGTLTIICSGESLAVSKAHAALLAMTGGMKNLCHVDGGIGAASSVKLINQLLAGVHIASAAEAMAFAARLDIDTKLTFDMIKSSGAWSWMFENRVPQMLDADWTPHSALAIFVKDLGIVLDEAARLGYCAPISSAAHTLYLCGAAHGWTKESDAGVVRLWELLGPSVASKAGNHDTCAHEADPRAGTASEPQPIPAAATLARLPPEYSTDVLSDIRKVVNGGHVPTLVVLDDDPTGTQTCHDIDVLTVWDSATLESEFSLNPSGFFILTNSRALPSAEARRLIQEICENVSTAAKKASKAFEIVLRGDSTLRGHLPEEPEAAEAALGLFDGWVITPFFAQGGRYTINDVHYVKEADVLVPASQTPFAQDATFGYKNSNLRQYVLEKCGSRFNDSSLISVTLDEIRVGGPEAVAKKLLSVPADPNRVFIVNAAAESDMHVFVAGLLEAEKSGRRYLYRTGAAFVSSRLGIKGIPPLSMQDLGLVPSSNLHQPGGLIIAGSYVPKTTAQLKVLREKLAPKLHVIELGVADLIASEDAAEQIIRETASSISTHISSGHDVLVMTSRTLIQGQDGPSSLNIGSKVAKTLVQLVELIDVRPRYIIAKGGITASDTATKGLRMRRARVLGQAAPGVPLWRCDEETSRHRGVPYVVFPGNVGSEDTLAEVVEAWAVDNEA
ncbi:hypothetical protein EsDP_00007328 [Epichloe bromicola]|uniref:Ketose-bisphosphate aldolase class-II family protein n=1 Tax=Epichloe bromicola TaxID=79588 RepID=A0ABQ0D0B4_9HYPO